jgi:MFS family permease
MIFGNVIYVLADLAPSVNGKMAMILVARVITGTGAGGFEIIDFCRNLSGIISVLRSYVANASTKADRTRAISINTACWTGGAAIGPALQAAFTPLNYPGLRKKFRIFQNKK